MPEIVYYERPDGSCPFSTWFDSLDPVPAARVATAIDRMADGHRGDVKPVGEGVSEWRINFGPGYRVYFGQDGRDLILLLTGRTKKRQQADVRQARLLWAEYKRR